MRINTRVKTYFLKQFAINIDLVGRPEPPFQTGGTGLFFNP